MQAPGGICLGELPCSCGFCLVVLLVSSGPVWSCFARLFEGFFFLAGCVLEVVFVPGPRGVTEAFWNVCCATVIATVLTSAVHRFDRCHRSERQKQSV
jgi:hypothetical protein